MTDGFEQIARAVALMGDGDPAQAVGLLKGMLAEAPCQHQGLFVAGEAMRQQGDNRAAASCFRRALRLVPTNNGDIHYRLGLTLFAAGEVQEAAHALRQAAELRPDAAEIRLSLAVTRLRLGHEVDPDSASGGDEPGAADSLISLAGLLERQGRAEDALRLLEDLLDLIPLRVDLVDSILNRHLDRRDPESAVAFLRNLLRRAPDDARRHAMLAWLFHTLRRADEAVSAYRLAIALAPETADYAANLGTVLRLAGAPAESQITAFRLALRLDPQSMNATLGLARTHLDRGDHPEAKALIDAFDRRTGFPRGPRRSIVIPVLNYSPGSPYNIRTLLDDLASFDGEVICIFNGDEVYDDLRGHPRIDKFSYNKYNVGVARGWNMGINQAEGDTIHILNADLHVSVDMLSRLETWLHTLPDALCVGVSAHWIDPRTLQEVKSFNSGTFTQPIETDSVSGQLFTLHAGRLHDAGISFDPRLSPYFGEEADLFIKARTSGLKIYAVPETDFEHAWGISVRDRPILMFGRLVHRTHCLISNQILLQEKAARSLSGG